MIDPCELSRAATDNTISTVLDISRSQSESSEIQQQDLSTYSNNNNNDDNIIQNDIQDDDNDNNNNNNDHTNNVHDNIVKQSISEREINNKKLLKIRDCLGLLRELFFMSRQTIPMEQRY